MSSLTIATLAAALIVLAGILSVEFGISVALIEIMLGVVGGNLFGLTTTPWMDFLASFATIVLTFLAGAEVDPTLLREKFKASMLIGGLSFLLPFALTIPVAFFLLGWDWRASEIAGVALSTTSLAVVPTLIAQRFFNPQRPRVLGGLEGDVPQAVSELAPARSGASAKGSVMLED